MNPLDGVFSHPIAFSFIVVPMTASGAEERIKSIAIDLRARLRLKLADAFVAATAAYWNIPLVTEDKHFRRLKEEIALYLLER